MQTSKHSTRPPVNELQISKFPAVSDVPMELYPFEKKVRLVEMV